QRQELQVRRSTKTREWYSKTGNSGPSAQNTRSTDLSSCPVWKNGACGGGVDRGDVPVASGSEPDRVLEPVSCPPLPHCSHVIIKFDYVFQVQPPFTNPHAGTRYDWARGDYAGIRNSLRNIDWDFELLSRDLTSLDSFLYYTLHDLISLFVPPMKSKCHTLPWLRKIPKNLTKLRTNIWKEYKELRRQHGRQSHQALQCLFNLNNLNARLKQTTMALQANYEGDLLKDKKTKPKLFHSYIRNKKVGRTGVGRLKIHGTLTDSPELISESFVEAFSGVFE
ncbi:hypothetical protein Pcinc_015075, partial [Petrolisthes cinctipes]